MNDALSLEEQLRLSKIESIQLASAFEEERKVSKEHTDLLKLQISELEAELETKERKIAEIYAKYVLLRDEKHVGHEVVSPTPVFDQELLSKYS